MNQKKYVPKGNVKGNLKTYGKKNFLKPQVLLSAGRLRQNIQSQGQTQTREEARATRTTVCHKREAASGLYDTTVGRDSFYDSDIEPSAPESPSEQVLYPDGDGSGAADGGGSTNTFVLDVVKDDNTAGTATFNGPGVN